MNHRKMTALIPLGLLFLSALPVLRASETGPEATIAKIRANILDPSFTPDGIDKVLIEALDASLAILPDKDFAAEYEAKIGWVKSQFAESHMFSEKIRQYLGLAYKLVANGAVWQLPEELKAPYSGQKASVEMAIKICGRLLDSALAEMKAGNNEKAIGHILGFVIIVVTPIEA